MQRIWLRESVIHTNPKRKRGGGEVAECAWRFSLCNVRPPSLARRASVAIGVCLALSCAVLRADEKPESPPTPLATAEYSTQELRGWKLYLHPSLLTEHAEVGQRVLALLDHQLAAIERRVPKEAVDKLRKIPVWIEYDEPHHPCMCYHPDAGWLREHGMNPDKQDGIEIANAENFLVWTIDQPWMVLHELAHGYHELFLPEGYENAAIADALKAARERQNYESVRHVNGDNVRHYALTNPMEYFAEGTEAYFGANDFYPFVRTELETHDPELCKLLAEFWGIEE